MAEHPMDIATALRIVDLDAPATSKGHSVHLVVGRVLAAAYRALQPPPGLPDVLATVDDLAPVCEAAGLVQTEPGRWSTWADDVIQVQPQYGICGLATIYADGRDVAAVFSGASSRQLWVAIHAARGGDRR